MQVQLDLPPSIYQQATHIANKTQRNVADVLTDVLAHSFSPFYEDKHQAHMLAEVVAFEEQHQQLVKRYLGEYVALHQGRIVDHDKSQRALLTRIEAQFPDEIVLIRQVQAQLPPPLRIRSPRFVR